LSLIIVVQRTDFRGRLALGGPFFFPLFLSARRFDANDLVWFATPFSTIYSHGVHGNTPMKSPPWLKFDHAAWLTDEHVRMMPLAARGIYIDLLARQFMDGSVPSDPAICARVIGESVDEVKALWAYVLPRFRILDDDPSRMVQDRMAQTRAEALGRSETNAANGVRGGRAKAANAKGSPDRTPGEILANATDSLERTPSERQATAKDSLERNPSHPLAYKIEIEMEMETKTLGETYVSPPPRACAREGDTREPLLLDAIAEPSPVTTGGSGEETKTAETRTKRVTQARLPINQDADRRAWLILDEAWSVIEQAHPDLAMSRTAWRQRNKAAALDLVRLEKTPEDVVGMLKIAYENALAKDRGMHMIVMLGALAEKWHMLAGIAQGTVKPFGSATASPPRKSIFSGVERH
jgi:hypothetical protein